MVSVIIPNYNHAAFLRERIDSVLTQTYTDFELIILDDCSTDNSREIIDTYSAHPKVTKILFNERNSGCVFKQWKKGLEHAQGEYVWIAESDDYAAPGFLAELVPVLQSKPAVGIVYCDSNIVRDDRSIGSKTFAQHRNDWLGTTKWEQGYVHNGRAEIAENLLEMCTINNASAVLFRKEVFAHVSPFDLGLCYTGDWYIYLKVGMQYDIAYVNRALNYYREHAYNSSKALWKRMGHVKEYFLIYNWAWENITFISRKRMLAFFKRHTRHSLVRNWDGKRLSLYATLFKLNKTLFWSMMAHNLAAPFKERANKSYTLREKGL